MMYPFWDVIYDGYFFLSYNDGHKSCIKLTTDLSSLFISLKATNFPLNSANLIIRKNRVLVKEKLKLQFVCRTSR